MIIDKNEIEKAAMAEFNKGNRELGKKIQAEFIEAFRKEYEGKDHCSCKKQCEYHGMCRECVAIHRAHQEHLPNCFQEMVNDRIRVISELTEHSFKNTVE